MKMALLGASGRVGQRITLEALVRGHVVKALVRNPESFPIAHPRLTVARVDIFDPASVAEAIADSDVVVNATGAGGSDPHTFYTNSTKAVIGLLGPPEKFAMLSCQNASYAGMQGRVKKANAADSEPYRQGCLLKLAEHC